VAKYITVEQTADNIILRMRFALYILYASV